MKCHVCGAQLHRTVPDLPFKRTAKAIVIPKDLPLLQCENCTEFVLEDSAMAAVKAILSNADQVAELEIVRYAACEPEAELRQHCRCDDETNLRRAAFR